MKNTPVSQINTFNFGSSLNTFSEAFFRQMLIAEPGNFLVSPLGIYAVLGMLQAGAKGNTLAELSAVTGLGTAELPTNLRTLAATLSSAVSAGDLKVSNQAWLGAGESILDTYRQSLATLGAKIDMLNFRDPNGAAGTINAWANEATKLQPTDQKGMIPKIVEPNEIDPAMVLMLANALLFQGKWQNAFNPRLTRERNFTIEDGNVVLAPSMMKNERLRTAQMSGYEICEVPYTTGSSMVIVLPNVGTAIDDVLGYMKIAAALTALRQAEAEKTDLQLPKWDQSGSYDLVPVLKAMGLDSLFTPPGSRQKNECDLSAITGACDLSVGLVKQDTKLTVDEVETRFAAVTIAATTRCASFSQPKRFIVDRPFAALLFSSNNILLGVSRVMNPLAG